MGLISLLILLGLLGVLGVRTDVVGASGAGYDIRVDHAAMTRAGLATPFSVGVTRSDGSALPGALTIRVDSSYLAMFDENGMTPTPESSYNTGQYTWMTFEIPEGSTAFEFEFDARLEPAVQWGRQASAAVLVEGVEKAQVRFSTWVMP